MFLVLFNIYLTKSFFSSVQQKKKKKIITIIYYFKLNSGLPEESEKMYHIVQKLISTLLNYKVGCQFS